ncbi:hypothetical protein DRQ25_06200 [Candidatus Fermentibacteria bacterium]|nr:MAG: hypothetical protein DRQ25_06200 [Candidatus Fermentibacteria bacterium]
MKKLMVSLLILFMITVNALGNVDILAVDGIPFVSWCTDMAYIAACPSGVVSDPVFFGTSSDPFNYASIGLVSPAQGDRLIIACSSYWLYMLPDTVYLLDPESLEVINQRSLSVMDLGFGEGKNTGELHLPRYCDGSDSFAVVASIGDCTTDSGVSLASASLSYPDVGSMLLCDTLVVDIGYGWTPPDLLGPVVLPGMKPLSISCHHTWNPMYFEAYILSHLHQETPTATDDSGEMYTHGIWGYSGEKTIDISISALGSSSSEAVGIWSDSAGVQFYSVFIDSIAPSYTYVFPFPYPTPSEPAAMTRNPSDNGLLLAWYHDGEIRIRHWENEWNDFDHIVASGQPSVSAGNIAVCSVDDGYWITWLPGGVGQPILAYVDRGTVTGIVPFEEPSVASLILHPSVNPFRESVTLTVEGDPLPESLDVFDITGRLVRVLWNDSVSNTFFWDGENTSGQEVPPSTYFIQASSAGIRSTVPLVKL